MVNLISAILPYLVLLSHIILVVLFLAIIGRRAWGKSIFEFVAKNSLVSGFIVALASVAGSLFYSEIVGFEACVLCWWQRTLLYPQVVIFGVALWKRQKDAFVYAVPLTILAAIIALYQEYANLGFGSILPCTAAGGACSKIYLNEFGYITIPVMSLTVSAYILLLAWAKNLYENRNA